MNKNFVFILFALIYLFMGLLIMGLVNGFNHAKWFDGGIDLIYGIILVYLSTLLYFSYKVSKNKNILYVIIGFIIIILERIVQIFLQEYNLKTNYQLTIINWLWVFVDIVMVLGFLFVIKGLWSVKND